MTLKHLLLFAVILFNLPGIAQKSYKIEYILVLKGQITDKDNKPVSNATVKTTFNVRPYDISVPSVSEILTDSLGNYEIQLKKHGAYHIEFTKKNFIAYHIKCIYSKELSVQMRKRKYELPIDVTLQPQTKTIKEDIYNGGELFFRGGEVIFTPYKKYLQAHDYKIEDGYKTTDKLLKHIVKSIQGQKLPALLSAVATRGEIDTVITSEDYYPEIRKKWKQFFGANYADADKDRIEHIQDFYAKINTLDDSGVLIYKYQNHNIDLTKTVMADDTKQVFNLYRFEFKSSDNTPLSYDIMLFKTLTGWKIHYISENYL